MSHLTIVGGGRPTFKKAEEAAKTLQRLKKAEAKAIGWKADAARSIMRYCRAVAKVAATLPSKVDMMTNIEFYNQNGRLPDNVDLAKVQGKGMYGG